jgi:hypothetical protein
LHSALRESNADAARQLIMTELVTKQDLLLALQDLQNAITHFDAKLDDLSLRLTVRLGIMLAAGIVALATLIKPA